jgi:hypothetical protein
VRLILDPRRSPRVPARLRVQVQHASEEWQAETEDLGPRGCLLVSPRPLEALAASPRDPEIAAAIGALAFRDRQVPQE